jgi:predicted metalloendopeptidase
MVLLSAATPAVLADSPLVSGIQTADMNKTARAQNDFFEYANGAWLRKVQIPEDRSRYGVDVMMAEQSLLQLRELIEGTRNSSDPDARKVADLYDSFMDEARIEQQGVKPLQPELELIDAVKSADDIGPLMAQLDRLGVATPIGIFVAPDAKRSTEYALWFSQGGLGLPDRDY